MIGLVRASYHAFDHLAGLVLYSEHLETPRYRDPSAFKDQI